MGRHSMTTNFITIGIDLGDKYSHVCVLDAGGVVIHESRCRTTLPTMSKVLGAWPGARLILETGTQSSWLARALTAAGFDVIVAHARQVRLITQSDRKNDRFDAEQLARLGRADPKLLHPVEIRSEQRAKDLTVLRTRDAIVRTRTMLINEARGVAKSLGVRLPVCHTGAFARRVRKELPADAVFAGLDQLLALIEAATQQVRVLDEQVETLSREKYPETVLMRQVAGVGSITGLAFALTVGDPHRFSSSRMLGAYFGLRPAQRDSGQKKSQLAISKSGDRFMRCLLVQASQYILGPFGPDTELRRFGLRLAERGGRAAKKKAVIAVARKLAVLMHRLWVSGEAYQPLAYGKEPMAA